MTVRNLDRLFQPRSIAVIGASKRPQSIGKRGLAQPVLGRVRTGR